MDAFKFCLSLRHIKKVSSFASTTSVRISKMVTASLHNTGTPDLPSNNVHIPLDSIPNFRQVDAHGKLYRSSKQDKASPEDLKHLQSLGIRTHLDLRSKTEYKCNLKAIDRFVNVLVPDALPDPKMKPYPTISSIQMRDLKKKHVNIADLSPQTQRRYLINFFSFSLVMKTFNSAPLYKQLASLLVLLFDFIMANHFKYFVRFFADYINKHGLSGQYVDMLEFGSKQICFALKTLSDPENLPALLSCAHGKDRTGIVTAMVLSILGKSDEYIAEEYALSEEGLKSVQSSIRADIVLRFHFDESFATAKKETMLKVLKHLRDRYGSVENFLESLGFGREDQERLRQVLS